MAFGSSKEKGMDWCFGDEDSTYGFTSPDCILQKIVGTVPSIEESESTIDEVNLDLESLSFQGDDLKRTGLLGDVLEQKLDGVGAVNCSDENLLNSHHLEPQTSLNNHIASNNMWRNTSALRTEDGFMMSDEEKAFEEIVLQDLEFVVGQMTRSTRVCFRDALYRLSGRLPNHLLSFQQTGETAMDVPSLSSFSQDAYRPGGMNHMETETNVMDRSIANLMFKEMEYDQLVMSCVTSTSKECYNYRNWT